MKNLVSTIILVLTGFSLFSQKHSLDSLQAVLKYHPKKDTTTVNAMNDIAWYYRNLGEVDSAFKYSGEAFYLAEKLNFIKGASKAKNANGVLQMDLGNFPEAIESFNEALLLREKINDRIGMAWCYNNIGVIHEKQGKYDLALKNHFTALKLREQQNDQGGVAASYNNICQVYMDLNNFRDALRYCQLSLQIKKKLDPASQSVAQSYINLGSIYHSLENFPAALNSYSLGLEISKANKNKRAISNLYNNMANVYNHLHDYEKSIEYNKMSLALKTEMDDKLGIASSKVNLGVNFLNQKKIIEARIYLNEGLRLNRELGNVSGLEMTYHFLSQLDSSSNNYKGAYENYKMHIVYLDSLINEENKKKTLETHLQYQFEKKAAADSVKTAESKKILTVQLEQEKTQRFALYGGIALVALFGGFMFNRFRVTQKQKEIIEAQKIEVTNQRDLIEKAKELVDEKQTEILDSINYAKTLQEAILPPLNQLTKVLPQSFILYKPKDIVAGDFYWFHMNESENGKTILLAAADCTGHGVPGAMVSVVCSNALNRSVKEFKLTDPGQILNKTRELVIETFEKSAREVKDGMDISLVSFSEKNSEDGVRLYTLKYAGANNPLWVIKRNQETSGNPSQAASAEGTELVEIKPDKQPVGAHSHAKNFTTHELELKEGDSLYLFTDGYADQFGGEKGKKLKYRYFQSIVLENSSLAMEESAKILDESFENWKGNLEQVDDVCVIGVRL